MKIRSKLWLIAIIALIALSFTACPTDGGTKRSGNGGGTTKPPTQPVDQAKDQSTVITNLFGKGLSATVKSGAKMTNAEWKGVADKIKTALNNSYDVQGSGTKDDYEEVFNKGVTIIVEKTPQGYTTWKTTEDGKTMYLAYDKLDDDLQAIVEAAFWKLRDNTAGFAKAIPSARDGFWCLSPAPPIALVFA